jgi:hypothetical protein
LDTRHLSTRHFSTRHLTLVYATLVCATLPCAKLLSFLCVILFNSLQNMPSIPKGERCRCPECSKDLAFSQRRRHIKTRHPDTDLVSVLAPTDAPLVESGHTFKRENRSRRFRRKLSADTRKGSGTRKVLTPEKALASEKLLTTNVGACQARGTQALAHSLFSSADKWISPASVQSLSQSNVP